ncbi:hypothetical protein QPK87_27900 [Kamptonema cortianum]|nr:hypothetical protein [Geitlerinema splendidum]MDK3160352.1 hypothetical protein [Kamptonema cortianum]
MPISYDLIPTCKQVAEIEQDDPPPPNTIPCKPIGTDACHIPCVRLTSGESRMMRASNKRACADGATNCLTVNCEVKLYPNETCGGGVWDEEIDPRKHCDQPTM